MTFAVRLPRMTARSTDCPVVSFYDAAAAFIATAEENGDGTDIIRMVALSPLLTGPDSISLVS